MQRQAAAEEQAGQAWQEETEQSWQRQEMQQQKGSFPASH